MKEFFDVESFANGTRIVITSIFNSLFLFVYCTNFQFIEQEKVLGSRLIYSLESLFFSKIPERWKYSFFFESLGTLICNIFR